ncbi:protein of unknown function (plasmid) [Caballeronia sp. S22]
MATVRLLKCALPCVLLSSDDTYAHVATTEASPLAWTFEPWIVVVLAVSLTLYLAGDLKLRKRGAQGRRERTAKLIAFAAGWLTLVVALVSPLHALSEWLFSAHVAARTLHARGRAATRDRPAARRMALGISRRCSRSHRRGDAFALDQTAVALSDLARRRVDVARRRALVRASRRRAPSASIPCRISNSAVW